ncbi:MAG: SUMF1/EgtB/PvdO family nonheme iron enzyme [Verrucomicrobiota bacterium]
MKRLPKFCLSLLVAGLCAGSAWAVPTVSNVTFSVQSGTKLVDVYYDLAGGTSAVSLAVSSDGGTTYAVPVTSVTGNVGDGVTVGTGKHIVWDAGTDWAGQNSTQLKVKVRAWDLKHETSYEFVKIPAGNYTIGDQSGDGVGQTAVSVSLSGYYMSVNDTTKAQWDLVRTWGLSNGYTDLATGAGKASTHPVQTVSWYDVVKWANAASEKEGLTPCYKVSGAVYRTGNSDSVTCDWAANGYRLPTDAEWEVAARGGLTGKRFPLGDTISQSQANYYSYGGLSYDLSASSNSVHPTYATGGSPYTSPVGSFAANGYGLYDMAGNVFQWCWDWWGWNGGGSNPRGPSTGSTRVLRGGCWYFNALSAASAARYNQTPGNDYIVYSFNGAGFRLARGRP